MAKVAVVKVNGIAQDSPCDRVYRQGRYSRAVDLGIHVTDDAVGLRLASKSKKKADTLVLRARKVAS